MKKWTLYLNDTFRPVAESPRTALFPDGNIRKFFKEYFNAYLKTWVLRDFVGGLIGFGLMWLLTNTYFSKAAQQAISPELWNIIVAFGLLCALAGVLLKLLRLHRIAQCVPNSARALLVFGSEAGAIAYGVLCAMLMMAVVQSEFGSFLTYLYTSVGITLMGFVAFLNFLVFWVLHCLQPQKRESARSSRDFYAYSYFHCFWISR
ncbi:MAG: hypothetical protein P8179_22640 [Candidatus Thiodiazotropha sp.]